MMIKPILQLKLKEVDYICVIDWKELACDLFYWLTWLFAAEEAFQIKKSSYSRKIAKQLKKANRREKQPHAIDEDGSSDENMDDKVFFMLNFTVVSSS